MKPTRFKVINGVITYFYENGWKAKEYQRFYWYIYNERGKLMRIIYGSDYDLERELRRLTRD